MAVLMRTFRKSTAIWAAVVALVGCTVAIPDAAHFPEARDAQADNAVADAADVAKDVKIDTVDAKDVAGTDAIDVKPDAPDVTSPPDADVAVPDAVTEEVADAVVEPDAAGTDALAETAESDAAQDAGEDAVDVGPSCTPTQCDDGNPCTFDDCGSDAQCTHANIAPTPCPDDGLPCTGDSCLDGVCSHTTLLANWCIIGGVCHVADELTGDGCGICQPTTTPVAWTSLDDSTLCTDGTACTVGDHCQAGTCLPGAVTTCDDDNPCTADVCDPASGCANPNLDDGSGCPSVGACKLPGYCVSGTCQSDPKLWSTSLDGGFGGEDHFSAVAITATGEIIAVGGRAAASGHQEGWAVRLNAASNLVENLPALVDAAGAAHYGAVAVASDGSIAIGGGTTSDAVLQLIAANGTPQQILPFSAWGAGEVAHITAVNGGGWLLLDNQAHAARITATGAEVWTAKAAAFGPHVLTAIAGTLDGGAIAVGYLTSPDATSASALAIRFSNTGAILWQRGFGEASTNYLGLAIGADGNLTAAGIYGGVGGVGVAFDRISTTGAWLGTNVAFAPKLIVVRAAVAAADGTWRLVGDNGTNAWQGGFDAFGNRLWEQTYDPGIARGVAVLSGGGAIVVGETGAPADGLVLRVDSWGSASCADSQLCANLTSSGCDDGFVCTTDLCKAGACSHNPIVAAPLSTAVCDDGDPCVVAQHCANGQCAGTASLQSSTDGKVTEFTHVGALPDGGAIVAGTANFLQNLDASGSARWGEFVTGSPIVDVAGLPNGWVVTLQASSMQRFRPNGASFLLSAIPVDGGAASAMTVLSDDTVVVVGTADAGTANQAAFIERFDAAWVGAPISLPGSFGLSQGLAIAASATGGCGVLTLEGAVAKLHRFDADLVELWSKPLSVKTDALIAAMPDNGWLVAGLGAKGVALERSGPDGAFEFAVQWPIAGLTDVRGLTVLPDGTSAVAVQRLTGGISQGGVARFGALGGLLSITWGSLGSQAFDLCAASRPEGVWTVGSRSGGGWISRSDAFGGQSCSDSGSCISQSLVCDDGNPCTYDGCTQGLCTITTPVTPGLCLDGGECSAAGACPLLGTCGDGKCNVNETSATCLGDCDAACDAMNCDDGDPCTIDYCQAGVCAIGGALDGTACASGKSCVLGQCAAPGCGDGVCASGETATNCAADCPACGDGVCSLAENNHLCPADCAKPVSGCENMCGWKSTKPGGGVCWCDPGCTPGAFGDCCDDKATFCP